MPVPFSSFLGVDPMTIFTPLTVGLLLLASLCGLGIGMLFDRTREIPKRDEMRHSDPSSLPKAA